MKWPDINITEVFNGVMILAALALAWVSRRLGKGSAAGQDEPMQLAGAVIDKAMAEKLADAFIEHREALEDNTEAIRQGAHAIENLSRDVQSLTQETIRASLNR
ncbi:hypothetical protein [Acuticoccus sediminis]|uniref:hypothetical protein n=1 Tax=Acuticoccus sediminis TaxID=2184697 RepID=UPI001CFEB51B|nr:hypothetical protein [Acuticoccus sediminis]